MSGRTAVRTGAHPADYRTSILLAALVAVGVWWGFGLPYSVATWLLDEQQLYWTLVCYAWEVPAAGLLGPVLVPQLWWRRIERRWEEAFATADVNPEEIALVEGMILDYPIRVAWVFFVTSVVGYAVGALQIAVFAQLPTAQVLHVVVLGLVTGLVGGLFAFLYLEPLLAPLLRDLGRQRPTAPPTGRRVPIRTKVFVCSFVLMVCTVPLFGTVFWNQAALILEEETGKRLEVAAQLSAERLRRAGSTELPSEAQWRAATAELGRIYLVDARGRVVRGADEYATLDAAGFRPALVATMLGAASGHAIDRTWRPRIVAFAEVGIGNWRVVAVMPRRALDPQLRRGLLTAACVFAVTLTFALLGGYLFAQRLSRPIEIVTGAANRTLGTLERPAELTTVRTNDEVGELAVALNNMTVRLHDLTDELASYSDALEERVQEATHEVATLYDATRAVTSTLDEVDVMRLVGDRLSEALSLRDAVVLRYSPHDGTLSGYVHGRGPVELRGDVDLSALWPGTLEPFVRDHTALRPDVPAAAFSFLRGPRVLCLPLVFKGLLIGAILASLESEGGEPNLALAGALGAQVAVALANVGLFETVQRHERELLRLIERETELREETSRDISRELHDGMGQSLTAIKLEIALLEQEAPRLTMEDITGRTQRLQVYVSDVIQEVRTMSQLLRPTMLDDLGLVPSIRSHVEGIGVRSGIETELHFPDDPGRLPPGIEVLLYRVAQEAMTNIIKHARARRVVLTLEIGSGHADLRIEDDGIGFDRRRGGHSGIGLLGMRERVAYHGGQIEIWSEPGEGTRIHLRVPITPADRADAV